MAKKMTAMGTGPATAVPAFAYLALGIALDYVLRPRFKLHASFDM